MKRRYGRVLGIMSGTSLDGVDFVLTDFRGRRPSLIRMWHRRFPADLQRRLFECAADGGTSWALARVHHDLGRFFARSAWSGCALDEVEAVGLHGQTVFHDPEGRSPATLQLGEPAYLAEMFRVPVVANFRVADLAAGGQGAPMATLFHWRVFGRPHQHVAVQNLGGIGNVTSIDATGGSGPRLMAFDTGPGNLLLDGAVRRLSSGRKGFDRDGRWAARGVPSATLLRGWLKDDFFSRQPPKSTGRERYGAPCLERFWGEMDALGLGPADRLATLTELTAASVAMNYRLHLSSAPRRVVLCGGGANNTHLRRRLSARLQEWSPGLEVVSSAQLGWEPSAIEGAAFALLARERLLNRPGNLPATTGARRAVLCGAIQG